MNKREMKKWLDKLSQNDLQKLHDEVQQRLEPDTSDFDEVDWEDVTRMQTEGLDRLEALKQARFNRDEAIADGDIEP